MKHQGLGTVRGLLLWLGAVMVTLTLWGGQRVQADVVDSMGPTSMLSTSTNHTVASTTADSTAPTNEVTHPPAASPASEREISGHIASLTVQGNKDANGMYSQGAEVKIEGSFNDAKGPIHSGDHIDLAWSTDNEVTPYLVAFSGQTALTHHGVHIGDFTVTETGGQLTFNDNVEQFMSGVQGTFFFNAKLYTRSQQDGMAKLVVGPYVEFLAVKGVPQSSDNPGALTHDQTWYGNKNGRAVPWNGKNWVDWDVRLNEYRAYLAAPIKLHDVIPAGLRLDPERLTFWIDNDEPINLAAFQARYPHSSIQLNGNTITAVFSQDEFSGRRITFRYKTEIQDLNALNFTNSLAGAYQLQGQEVQNFTYQKTVQNISFGADITGMLPGELKIFKYYPTDKGPQALAGVTFRIKNVATGETFEATTEQNGIITRQRMLPGKYEVREISAPDWIDFAKVQGQVWTVEVLEDQPGQTLMIKNEKKRTSIPWTDYSNNPAKTVIPWTDYSNNPAKTVIPWTDYSNNPAKTVIPWTDYSNNPAKTVIPWTDYSNNPAKTVIPWTDYSNNPAKTVIPWTDYSNNPAKTVIPWTDYSNNPAKTVIPWTDYSNNVAKTVIPWTDYSNNVAKTVKPALPAEQPTKWLPLAPATVITMNQPNSTPHATSITITDQTPVRDTNQAQLPQTGTASESILLEIGLALLSICFGVSRTRWKQS
ncbi:MSCRAMM family protein [Limosilactobacillus ingluviei]|uniref:MSCRAMM family protein n=2 Tax=Limosilactobacillus ingluviei TaxID=148604 RepID=UPI0002DF58E7|nr:SpaA isopeptide-forming pilin-related protein [Limosilactobacillus ingluviei]